MHNRHRRFLLTLLISTTITASYADPLSNSYWICTASDQEQNQWTQKNLYQRASFNKAFDDCKKNSTNPRSCEVGDDACDHIVNGRSTRPMWHCTALDQMAKAWKSNAYKQRNDAALAAKSYCQQHSSMPQSCYINLLTCKNQNEL